MASILSFIVKTPLEVFLMLTCFTGLFWPAVSLYLKPVVPLAVHSGLPLSVLAACGSEKTCWVGLVPSARTVRVAPPVVGLPTMLFGLAFSFALAMTFRFWGVLVSLI